MQMESPLSFFWNKIFLKELKMMFLYKIRLKMDQKDHIIDQKGLKMYEKRQKIVVEFWT